MKFGPINLDDAEGAILAHSLRFTSGDKKTIFKKGRRLTAADISALRVARVPAIIVAQIEANDIHEDRAAAQLASACAGQNLKVTAPFTGRCNLVAETSGLLVIDRQRVDQLNAIDESITIATLGEFEQVTDRQMAATVKIIPFATSSRALTQAIEVASDGAPLASVAPYVPSRVALIQTRTHGLKDSILNRTTEVTRARIEAMSSKLIGQDFRCAHQANELAEAIGAISVHSPDVILIAGASAIVDRRDTLPEAIVKAGGQIVHFGMPVDPGNLLLLGEIEFDRRTVPILGLPGCARSPKLNGFDWILQRLMARIPVKQNDIMRMGVGGLLKEIPARPQPRDKVVQDSEAGVVQAQHAPQVAALVLAAGQSRRMGADNKLLAQIDGVAMVRHVVRRVAKSDASKVVVVTGNDADQVCAELSELDVTFCHNPDYADGLSTSMRTGLAAIDEMMDAALVQLGDMPDVRVETINRLIAAFNPVEGRAICIPTFDGRRGNPVLWGRRFFGDLAQVQGDMGGRRVLAEYPELVCEVATDDPGILNDVDTPEALARMRKSFA